MKNILKKVLWIPKIVLLCLAIGVAVAISLILTIGSLLKLFFWDFLKIRRKYWED